MWKCIAGWKEFFLSTTFPPIYFKFATFTTGERRRGWSDHRLLVISSPANYWHLIDSGQQTCQYLPHTITARLRSLSELWATSRTWGTRQGCSQDGSGHHRPTTSLPVCLPCSFSAGLVVSFSSNTCGSCCRCGRFIFGTPSYFLLVSGDIFYQ